MIRRALFAIQSRGRAKDFRRNGGSSRLRERHPRCGRFFGITGVRRIAALAEPYYVAIAPKHAGGPVATAVAIHLAASMPDFFAQHLPIPADPADRAMRAEIVSLSSNAGNPETGCGGFLALPAA